MSELSTVSSHHQNSEYDESFAEMIFLRWVGVRIKLRFLSFIFFVYEPSTYCGLSHIHSFILSPKVSVKVQDKDFTVRPVSPMYGSADLLCKGAGNVLHLKTSCTLNVTGF